MVEVAKEGGDQITLKKKSVFNLNGVDIALSFAQLEGS